MKALIAGATGLVGGELLSMLLDSNHYSEVIAITRKPLPEHSKLMQFIASADELSNIPEAFEVDDVFCCLGTTIKKAGSKEAFRKIDFDYPFDLANRALKNGAKQFLIVTALGANSKSSIFYNRVKGEIEQAICDLGFESVNIFRPSLLLGSRDENRFGEQVGKVVFSMLDFMIIGPLRKYKGVEGATVAKAMFKAGTEGGKGIKIYPSNKIQEYK